MLLITKFYFKSVILSHFILKQKIKLEYFYIFTAPCENSKTASISAFSIMENIVACCSRFPAKLICCIAFGSTSSACCLLKSIAMVL